MSVKRWVIQRKGDGKYQRTLRDGTHWTKNIDNADVLNVVQCYFDEIVIPVVITISRVPRTVRECKGE